jgi:hypothetical protein
MRIARAPDHLDRGSRDASRLDHFGRRSCVASLDRVRAAMVMPGGKSALLAGITDQEARSK